MTAQIYYLLQYLYYTALIFFFHLQWRSRNKKGVSEISVVLLGGLGVSSLLLFAVQLAGRWKFFQDSYPLLQLNLTSLNYIFKNRVQKNNSTVLSLPTEDSSWVRGYRKCQMWFPFTWAFSICIDICPLSAFYFYFLKQTKNHVDGISQWKNFLVLLQLWESS